MAWSWRMLSPFEDEGPGVRRRGRLIMLLNLTVMCLTFLSASIMVLQGVSAGMVGSAVNLCGVAVSAWLAWRYRALRAAVHVHLVGGFFSAVLPMYGMGGVYSFGLSWLALFPLVAIPLAGRRAGVAWTAICILTVIGLGWLKAEGLQPPPALAEADRLSVTVIYEVLLFVFIGAIAYGYEVLRLRSLAELRAAQAAVAEALEDASSAHRAARALLDHATTGLVMLGPDGTAGAEASAVVHRLLGDVKPGEYVWDVIGRFDGGVARHVELAWHELIDGFTPAKTVMAELPDTLAAGDLMLQLDWHLLDDGAILWGVRDVSRRVAVQAERQARDEALALLARWTKDPEGVKIFLEQCDALMAAVADPSLSAASVNAALHTLKGNAAIMGLHGLASTVHTIESALVAEGRGVRSEEYNALLEARAATKTLLGPVLRGARLTVDVQPEELDAVLASLRRGTDVQAVVAELSRWRDERASVRLSALADAVEATAERLGVRGVQVHHAVTPASLRVPAGPDWANLWSTLVHVVRNAVDHGLRPLSDAVDKRVGLTCEASEVDGVRMLCLRIEDNGAGIDEAALRRKAAAAGMEHAAEAPLAELIFTDGLSSRTAVNQTSGRGVGMSAVREAVEALNGTLTVEPSESGGTVVTVRVPRPVRHRSPVGATG